jgi:mRNA interferase YafQ
VESVVQILASGKKLDPRYKDHQTQGDFEGFRECHIRGDLLLIYKIEKDKLILVLINIGSHSELFG